MPVGLGIRISGIGFAFDVVEVLVFNVFSIFFACGFTITYGPGVGDLVTGIAIRRSLHGHGVSSWLAKRPVDVAMSRVGLIDDLAAAQLQVTGVSNRFNVTEARCLKDVDRTRPTNIHEVEVNVLVACLLCLLGIPTRPDDVRLLGLRQKVRGRADGVHALGGIRPRVFVDPQHYVIAGTLDL